MSVGFLPFTTGTQYSLNLTAASALHSVFHPSWLAAPQIFLTDQQRGNAAPQKEIPQPYRSSDFYCLVHLLVFWLIEAVCQTALATVVPVKVAGHEDSSPTLL